ncbi:hypothetical protein WG902_19135 [Ramlibacter sp. PS3R-8]|uniref:hypothetical protein n=1 Tax=Ramlibacter sp. PS3R-8 TaxID=3133437 RepID=UPI0030B6A24A
MQPTATHNPSTAIPVPHIDSDEPVAVIPAASVAPLDGAPDGERINTFIVARKNSTSRLGNSGAEALGVLRAGALRKPLTSMAAAFSIGYLIARMLR